MPSEARQRKAKMGGLVNMKSAVEADAMCCLREVKLVPEIAAPMMAGPAPGDATDMGAGN